MNLVGGKVKFEMRSGRVLAQLGGKHFDRSYVFFVRKCLQVGPGAPCPVPSPGTEGPVGRVEGVVGGVGMEEYED